MSRFRSRCPVLIAGALAAVLQSVALAAAALDAAHVQMAEIESLAGLPAQIGADLGADDKDAISDRGGPFNPAASWLPANRTSASCWRRWAPAQQSSRSNTAASFTPRATANTGLRMVSGRWSGVGAPALNLAGPSDLLAQHARSAQRMMSKPR